MISSVRYMGVKMKPLTLVIDKNVLVARKVLNSHRTSMIKMSCGETEVTNI